MYEKTRTVFNNQRFLLVDIGNTSTHMIFWSGNRPQKEWRMETNNQKTRLAQILANKFPLKKIQAVLISSVVPWASKLFITHFNRLGLKTLLAGKDFPIPMKNAYKKPKQVGMDRLLNALAVWTLYKKDAVIIDFGTAITFDVVTKNGAYLGGAIAPGIEVSLEALFLKTALLPKVRFQRIDHVIGRNTSESILSGCCIGLGGLCDRIVERVSCEIHKKIPLVIATGGNASFMSAYCSAINKIDPLLLMRGLLIAYSDSVRGKSRSS